LQVAFEKLHSETNEAFKRLAGLRKVNAYLEARVSETEQQLKALKKSMVEKPLVNIDSYTGCDGCFYLRKDIVCLEAKLNAPPSKLEITFAIDPKKFKKSLNPKNKKYKFMVKENSKSQSNVVCHYCCTKGHAIAKCRARKLLVPKGILQWTPKVNKISTYHLGPNENWGPPSFV
jgi:hypothetical protein